MACSSVITGRDMTPVGTTISFHDITTSESSFFSIVLTISDRKYLYNYFKLQNIELDNQYESYINNRDNSQNNSEVKNSEIYSEETNQTKNKNT